MKKLISRVISEHERVFRASFVPARCATLEKISGMVLRALKSGKKVLLCGNGGSAADAQHISAEFIGRFKRERKSLPAIALTTDTSILTSLANDYDFESVFRRQVEGLGRKGDVLIAISTSGNSRNVIEAVHAAKRAGIQTVGLTGEAGGQLAKEANVCYCAASRETARVQEMHITALHAVCEAVEEKLFA